MRARTKLLIEKYTYILVICFFFCAVIWVNIHRLQDNLYANYEKTVEYGRVREIKENIAHVMSVIFYEKQQDKSRDVASYIEHFEYYRKHDIRMVIISKKLDKNNEEIIENLFWEIGRYNNFNEVILVSDGEQNLAKHKELIQGIMSIHKIKAVQLTQDDAKGEKIIAKKLNNKQCLVVFLSDFAQNSEDGNMDFLYEEAVYFAQRNNYHLNVFDMVDTDLAKAYEKNYIKSPLSFYDGYWLDRLNKQKNNLQNFLLNYKEELLKYFILNLQSNNTNSLWPHKTPRNYRLFDRGDVYVKLLDDKFSEIFSYGRVERNEGVVVMLVNIAKKAAKRINLQKVKYIKLYLLTELEKINYHQGDLLANYLSDDDGIVVRYEKFYAIMLPEDRPAKPEFLIDVLRYKAGVPSSVGNHDIQFYRFKTAETEYEN